MIGKTEFACASAVNPWNQDLKEYSENPTLIMGLEAGADVGTSLVFQPTFAKAMNSLSYSCGSLGFNTFGPKKVSFAIGLGAAVSFGSDNFGLSGVLGIGATIKTGNQTSLLYSISITNQENEKNHTGSKWSVGNLHPITDANNVTIGYLGLVIERYKGEWGKDAVTNNTGIIVYSPAKSVLEDGKI
jgi:hypothetical protein